MGTFSFKSFSFQKLSWNILLYFMRKCEDDERCNDKQKAVKQIYNALMETINTFYLKI